MRPSFVNIPPIYGFTALALASSVAANYYIDNASANVTYTASETSWQTFSLTTANRTVVVGDVNITIDSSKCYHSNYALAVCTANNNCRLTISFKGHGITVYVIHAGSRGIGASLTIDDDQSITQTLPPPTAPSYQTARVTLFDHQSLPSADHMATIDLLGWNNGTTSLYFDYAVINDTVVEPVVSDVPSTSLLPSVSSTTNNTFSTSPATASPFFGSTYTPTTTSAVSSTHSSVNLGAVVGGACGGLAALIAIVVAAFFVKKRKFRHAKLEESRRPNPFLISPTPARDQTASLPVHSRADEKSRMRLAARNGVVHRSRGQSVDEPIEVHILSETDNTRGTPEVDAGPSPIDSCLHDDLVIDCRREEGSLTGTRRSVVRDASPTVSVDLTPPPGYETLEDRRSDAPSPLGRSPV